MLWKAELSILPGSYAPCSSLCPCTLPTLAVILQQRVWGGDRRANPNLLPVIHPNLLGEGVFVSSGGLGWLRHQRCLDLQPVDVFHQLTVLVKTGLGKPWVFMFIFRGQDCQYQNLCSGR